MKKIVLALLISSPLPIGAYDYDVHLWQDRIGQNTDAKVDYFMLALSYSPDFCDHQKKRKSMKAEHRFQCTSGHNFSWVIHGLWAQDANARWVSDHPRFCKGDLPPVPSHILHKFLPHSPSKKLLQGSWEKHGSCAFDRAEDYFNTQQRLFLSLKLPKNKPPKRELLQYLQRHNPSLRNRFIQLRGSEIRICYSTTWQVIDCPR